MSGRPLTAQLRAGLHAYRQLGARGGTATAARRLANTGRGRVRALQLRRRPLAVTHAELALALGGRDVRTALAAAGDALPSLRRWEVDLAVLGEQARTDLISRADVAVAHRFDLLGSGLTELGHAIDWHRDFKSGRSWPLDHVSRLRISYPDTSDIKVPWELSRFQHLPLLAAAYRLSSDESYLNELGRQLNHWIATNPVEFGVNWACTMDVAIRAINWVAALSACAESDAPMPWIEDVASSLLLHARFIRGHLEYGVARGNHYLSDIVGLLVVAGVFAGSAEGREWLRSSVRELGYEMHHQVRSDGCAHEASISYHRLVTELFIIGADAADQLAPGELDPIVRERLAQMLSFVADYTRPDGLAPQIGDADDGRVLPLGDYASADQRSHLHLFRQANRPFQPRRRSSAYVEGGYYFLRVDRLYAAVRCGDVGIYGRGCHAHNDLMAFDLCYGTTPLVVDPGSYLYTADPEARNRFRSTAVHSTMQLDGAEQNELREDRLFAMVDRTHAEVLMWETGSTWATLRCRHYGYETLRSPAIHMRTLHFESEPLGLEIIDEVHSDSAHELMWTFPLAPCEIENSGSGHVVARFPDVTLQIVASGVSSTTEHSWISPSYGVRLDAPAVRFRGRSAPGRHQTVIALSVRGRSLRR